MPRPSHRAALTGALVMGGVLGLVSGLTPKISDARTGRTPTAAIGAPTAKTIAIQPLGRRLSKQDVAMVVQGLKTFYGLPVQVLGRKKLPRSAYYRPRRRYRAEKLLGYLEQVGPRTAYRILGLTAVDISTTKGRHPDWGIMGLANLSGRLCIISRFRCQRGARNALHARYRLAKTAVHEIGHTLGLDHCPTRGCLLESGKGSNKTTDREYVLCPRCRAKLRRRGYNIPPNPSPPWPKP